MLTPIKIFFCCWYFSAFLLCFSASYSAFCFSFFRRLNSPSDPLPDAFSSSCFCSWLIFWFFSAISSSFCLSFLEFVPLFCSFKTASLFFFSACSFCSYAVFSSWNFLSCSLRSCSSWLILWSFFSRISAWLSLSFSISCVWSFWLSWYFRSASSSIICSCAAASSATFFLTYSSESRIFAYCSSVAKNGRISSRFSYCSFNTTSASCLAYSFQGNNFW